MIDHKDNINVINDELEEQEEKSRSQLKREAQALYDLGVELTKLPESILIRIPMNESLRQAVDATSNIHSNSARKRHLLFIGKLMRQGGAEEIRAELDRINKEKTRQTKQLHLVEEWRDRLLKQEKGTESQFFDKYPHADRQTIRQLIRNADKEMKNKKPPASSRKLFKIIREVLSENN